MHKDAALFSFSLGCTSYEMTQCFRHLFVSRFFSISSWDACRKRTSDGMLMATSPSFFPISDSRSTGDAPVPFAGHRRYSHSGGGRWIKFTLPQVIEISHRAGIALSVPSSRRFASLCHAQVALDSHPYSNRVTEPFLFCPASILEDAASFRRL